MRDDPEVIALVARARKGDQAAWDEIVERYSPLVWAICLRYRLTRPDSDDVAQVVWLRLVENLDTLREPAALAGWLATTAQRECLRVSRNLRKVQGAESPLTFDPETESTVIDQELERAERHAALLRGLAQLPARCRCLLELCLQEESLSYTEISARLGVPVGGIGPTRARCLAKLRRILEGHGDAGRI
ncbi:RNA polymerase sigma factor [Herbidospora mongoliensis]|uniref:RNA polymerase sigma factor n=1 Tax=Herbidospora mongoliensis TaxID=688067 RepID=UPI00083063E4|nr:sigma-70 family RNA polymerase sigma factor [Herbidospora mongoliensis]